MTVVRTRYALIVIALTLSLSAHLAGETLGQVLTQSGISAASHPSPDRDITSYGILKEPSLFCIAFYWDDGSGSLGDQLELLLVDRMSSETRTATLRYDKLISDQPNFRTGSITRVMASPNFLFLGGHLSPSAGNVLVLAKDLSFQAALKGWPLATLDSDIVVFHKSQVHFAPVHAAEIAIYNPHTQKEEQIYPRRPFQEVRQSHIDALKRVFDTRPVEWFAQHNRPSDPEWFDNYLLGDVVTNSETNSLAFLIRINNRDLLPDDDADHNQKPADHTEVAYIYRGIGETSIEYKEILARELESRFGTGDLSSLTQPSTLARIFE